MLCTCCCSIIIDFWSGGRHVELLVSFLPVGHFYQDKGRQNFLGIFFFTFALDLASPHLDKLVDKILFRTETVSSATLHAFVESNTAVIEAWEVDLPSWTRVEFPKSLYPTQKYVPRHQDSLVKKCFTLEKIHFIIILFCFLLLLLFLWMITVIKNTGNTEKFWLGWCHQLGDGGQWWLVVGGLKVER